MITGAVIFAAGYFLGNWSRQHPVVTTIKRKVLSQQAKIIDPTDPLEAIDLSE